MNDGLHADIRERSEGLETITPEETTMPAPLHPCEVDRLGSLRRHALLETASDRRFNRLIYMTAQLLRVHIATLSVVAEDRQWFKASVGMARKETPREEAFCAYTILSDSMMVVEDTLNDSRFAGHPSVTGAPFIRFYAGVPLLSRDRLPLGALCAIDTKPRTLTTEQHHALLQLAREAEELVQATEL